MSLLNLFRRASRNSQNDSNTDIQVVENYCFSFIKMPSELIIHIGQYMNVKELHLFASCSSSLLKILFNLDKKQLKSKSNINYQKDEKDMGFHQVQELIWKPLLIYYYPRFEQSLNIKNWMHVLRRRLKHVKLYKKEGNAKDLFSLEIPDFVKSKHDEEIIENCEWIYKCPLHFEELTKGTANQANCNVCKKTVYKVKNMKQFTKGISEGKCMAFAYNNVVYKGLFHTHH